ncbi:MAG: ABC transporter substrate-binding protein [Saprospiraceae bacterium]
MILVLNHRQQLSGNSLKYFLFILSFSFLFSCSTSRKSTRVLNPVRTKPTTNATKKERPKVDTVQWNIVDGEKYKPITSNNIIAINPLLKPINKISLLIPFKSTNDPEKLSRSEKKFSHYYAGSLIALEELEALDINIQVNVFDTERNVTKVNRLLQNVDVRNSDVIIGPYETANLKKVAEWGKNNNIPVISPWRSSSNVTENNLYYYQMRPLIEQYFEAILKDALNNYNPSQIYIINQENNSDDTRVRAIHRMYESMNRGKITTPLNEYMIVTDSIKNSDFMMFDSLFMNPSGVALIIPDYSSKDARYVYSLIRKINAEIKDQEIEIYGMPTLINAQRLDLEFFRSLNLKTVDFKHLNKASPLVKNFASIYFEKFGHLPNADSYHGYDTIVFLANISQSVKNVNNSEMTINLPLLSMGVNFRKYNKNRLTNSHFPQYHPGDFMVNTDLKLIEYTDNEFKVKSIK